MTDRLLTPADAAERCQLSTKTVLRAIHAGRLRASRLGERGGLRIRESDVDAWIEESVVTPRAPRHVPMAVPPRHNPDGATGWLSLPMTNGRAAER